MSAPKQWDISKALVTASLFTFLHSAGSFCVLPFLSIFLRHFGLSAALVGIIMGVKHLVCALWAPVCCFVARTTSKRRMLLVSSLVLSAVVSGVLTFFPPLPPDMVVRFCNLSLDNHPTAPAAWDMEMFGPKDNGSVVLPDPAQIPTAASAMFTSLTNGSPITNSARETLKDLNATTPHRPKVTTPWQTSIHPRKVSKTGSPKRPTKPKVTTTSQAAPAGHGTSMRTPLAQEPHFDHKGPPPRHSEKRDLHKKTPPPEPFLGVDQETFLGVDQETFLGVDQETFLGVDQETFLVVLGLVLLWEVVSSPLEWTADDSVYEYLDFVDATDRHEKIWIWRYLGASLGSFSIVFLMDHASCFLRPGLPRIYLHFYGYSTFMVLTLLLSPMYPVHVSKKTQHASRTLKALGLLGSDGRMVLLSVTVFLMGAARSAADNFLFWRIQDLGGSELYMGLSVVLALASEVVLYVFKGKVMRSLSFRWMVGAGLLCQGAELLYYSFLWAPWAVLPIQLTSAFSNGVLLWAVRSQVEDVASPGTERSLQLVLHCLSHHCGASLGSFSGGFVIARFGLATLFQSCSAALLIWLLMFLVIQPKLPHVKKINYSRLLAPDNSDLSDSEEERDWLVKAMKDEGKVW